MKKSLSSSFLNKNDYSYENDTLELLNLKNELNKLTKTMINSRELGNEEFDQREKSHNEKLELFKQRARLNNNRFINVLNANETAIRVTNERREEIERMKVDKDRLGNELTDAEMKLSKVRREADKYRAHNRYLAKAFELMKTSEEVASISEVLKRHETLRLNWDETIKESERKMDMIREIKSNGDAKTREMSNEVIGLYQTRIDGEKRLAESRHRIDQAEHDLEASRKAYIDKILELYVITESVDNMFRYLTKESPSNDNYLTKRMTNQNKSPLRLNENSVSTKTFFQKLDFIERRYLELEEMGIARKKMEQL